MPNPVKPVETTGAGDAFASTFLLGLIKKKSVDICLKLALLNAESVIMDPGAKNGLQSYNALKKALKKKAPKIKKKKI